MVEGAPLPVEIVTEDRHRALAASAAALVASGTATLECALLDVPMVVGYRLHPVSYALAKLMVRVPHVALVNLVAGKRIVAEAVQNEFNQSRLLAEVKRLFGAAGPAQRQELALVRKALGEPGASARAARAVLAAVREAT
jgi:lipid-A-disaccharide synthase